MTVAVCSPAFGSLTFGTGAGLTEGDGVARAFGSFSALAEFENYQQRRNLARRTIEQRRNRLVNLTLWVTQHRRKLLLDVDRDDVNGWLDSLGIQPQTRNGYLTCLGAFFRWAVREGHMRANPVDLIDRAKLPAYLPRPTPDDDLAIAFHYADPRMRAWLCLTALEGFRCCEVARLRVEDIDVTNMRIRAQGKGAKERVVPLHPVTLDALRAYGLPLAGWVFVKQDSPHPFAENTISCYVAKFFRELGSTTTAHQNRHWFATMIHAQTGDLMVTRDLLGHASTATTEVYTKLLGSRGDDAVAALAVPSA